MVELTEVQKTLTRKNSLRAAVHGLGLELVEKMIADLHEIRDDLVQEALERKAAEQERQKKVEEARRLIADMGLSVEEVLGGEAIADKPKTKRRRATAKPKYKLGDVTWAGRGRVPLEIQTYLDGGGKLADLLIDKMKPVAADKKPNVPRIVAGPSVEEGVELEQDDESQGHKKKSLIKSGGLFSEIMGRH